jgi:uncharacterized protein DUF4440/uncharacterized protein DUF3471
VPRTCLVLLALSLGACATATAARPADPTALLRQRTQALLDAIATGGAPLWDRTLDPRAIYVSEAGDIETKASLLAQLTPLPDGISGRIAIGRFQVELHGDTAIVLHVDHESEDYFGHPLTAEYTTLNVWQHGPAGWRLIAAQVHANQADPPAIQLPAAELDALVGSYRLTDAIRYEIRREGDHLVGQRTGRPPQPLAAEARDVFFVAGQPRNRKIFLRDPSGRVTGFADRREGRDLRWSRVAP